MEYNEIYESGDGSLTHDLSKVPQLYLLRWSPINLKLHKLKENYEMSYIYFPSCKLTAYLSESSKKNPRVFEGKI
jgi:hypothetical protein